MGISIRLSNEAFEVIVYVGILAINPLTVKIKRAPSLVSLLNKRVKKGNMFSAIVLVLFIYTWAEIMIGGARV